MTLIEKSLNWSLISIVGLIVAGSLTSALFAGVMGLLADPAVLAVVAIGFVGFALLLAVPAAFCGLWLWRHWQMSRIEVRRANQFVAPDEAGRLPVPASLLRQPEFAHRAMDAHQASFMSGLTTFNYQPANTQNITGADGETVAAAATVAPGTFWQLYQAGQLPKKGFLLGNNLGDDSEHEPVTADWTELYSTLVGGKSRMGKSTLVRSILAQSALQGGKFIIVDPHYGAGDDSLGESLQPLRNLLLCDVAVKEQQIVDALRFVDQIGARRLSGQDKERWPLILVVDETTGLFQRSNTANELTRVLGNISQETGKVGIYAMCLGQNFDGRIMDTTVRNSFVSMITMRTRRDVARVQSGSTEFGKLAETLTVGQCVWMSPSGELYKLAVPNCTTTDLEQVARTLHGKNVYEREKALLPVVQAGSKPGTEPSSEPSSEPIANSYLERHFPKTGTGGGTGKKSAAELAAELAIDERAQQVIDRFLAGNSQNAILKELWGDPQGNAKVTASAEFNAILRSHMMKIGVHSG